MSVTDPEDILRALAGEAPDAGDTFRYGDDGGGIWDRSYRVTGWLRRRPPRPPNPDPRVEAMLQRLTEKHPRQGAGPDDVPLEFCTRAQAEYVCGVGVAGVIVRVSDVVVDGHIDFRGETREEARRDAEWLAGEPLV